MILHCPICNEKVRFDRFTPKVVLDLFKKIGCPSLQFDHKVAIEKKDESRKTNTNQR